MNDYNRGALPVPCLRLDFGFGEQWDSVELGDGTGYVRLADYEKMAGENAGLRERIDASHMSRLLTENENDKLRELLLDCWDFSHLMHGAMAARFYELGLIGDGEARELGIEVDE